MWGFWSFFYVLGVLTISTNGLKCFSCTLTVTEGDTDPDLTCVNSPSEVPGRNIITCPERMKFCTIVRNDIRTTGAVSNMERNCAEDPVLLNEDVESDELISHYRSCQTDLCNKGTGLETPDNGSGGTGAGGMLVPGKNAASPSLYLSFLLVSFCVITALRL